MNENQRKCLIYGLLVIVAMAVYPPWIQERTVGTLHLGPYDGIYAFVTSPPQRAPVWFYDSKEYGENSRTEQLWQLSIDYKRLAFQWAFVCIITAGLFMLSKGKPNESSASETVGES